MKPINLLPKIPYLIKRRDFLALLIAALGLVVLAVQIALSAAWANDEKATLQSAEQMASQTRDREAETTLDARTQYYQQASAILKTMQDSRRDYLPVIDNVLSAMIYQGQIVNLNLADGNLVINTLNLNGDQVTDCIKTFEAIPDFKNMTLTVTEHKVFQSEDKAELYFQTGESVPLTDQPYFTLQLDIKLPATLSKEAVNGQ